jgi:hypothetical protein
MASTSTGKQPEGAFAEGEDELKLVNQLGESRSPYVSAWCAIAGATERVCTDARMAE